MRNHGLFVAALCGLAAATGCGAGPKVPQESVRVEQRPTAQAEPPQVTAMRGFDLGGPCLAQRPRRPNVLTAQREKEWRASGQWDALIDAHKEDVRSDCSVPHRWQALLMILVEAQRYREAAQVATEVAMRGFAFPHAILSGADPRFLSSDEFTLTDVGMEYIRREADVQQNMRVAGDRLASMDATHRPPNVYRSVGACPFECCTYREWTTRSAVQLQESIDSQKVVGTIPAGARVRALTGEVRVEPQPYAVLEENGALKAGDVIFFLDYRGEGDFNYWFDGKLRPELGLSDELGWHTTDNCNANAVRGGKDPCWLRKLRPERTVVSEWWVQIQTPGGIVGWTLVTGQFGNADACGSG